MHQCEPHEADILKDGVPYRLETAPEFFLAQQMAEWLVMVREARSRQIVDMFNEGVPLIAWPLHLWIEHVPTLKPAQYRTWDALGDVLSERFGLHIWHPDHWQAVDTLGEWAEMPAVQEPVSIVAQNIPTRIRPRVEKPTKRPPGEQMDLFGA